ncbi:MAG: hypothetical protein IKH75_01395 [Ruminococcus sp.]|nr:hypothetical protein [Ruminococcus sp.]
MINDIKKARMKKELLGGFKVDNRDYSEVKLKEIIDDVCNGNMIVYDAEDFVIANKEAIKRGQIRILPIPRLLTAEEIIDMSEDYFAWIEMKDRHDIPTVYCLRVHAKWYEQSDEAYIDFDTPSCLEALCLEDYGKKWRCWSACPSEEMQEGAEWQ